MASPVQVPPPPPRYRRSMSGPVILIAVGIVFLLGTMGVLDWHNLGHWFAHYWPLLLIIAAATKTRNMLLRSPLLKAYPERCRLS